jgi:hypothetical protein
VQIYYTHPSFTFIIVVVTFIFIVFLAQLERVKTVDACMENFNFAFSEPASCWLGRSPSHRINSNHSITIILHTTGGLGSPYASSSRHVFVGALKRMMQQFFVEKIPQVDTTKTNESARQKKRQGIYMAACLTLFKIG